MATLADLKAELGIEHAEFDAILTRKLDGATSYVEAFLGKTLADFDPVPASVNDAIIRLAAHRYSIGDGIPEGLTSALNLHRKWVF